MPQVSVIVPVYKAEPFFAACCRGLFGQTLEDMEYIFVDDCTPDRSMEILREVLEEYPRRKGQVRCLRMPVNSGQAAVRAAGLEAATGEFVIHCDSDDIPAQAQYETLLRQALQEGADIAVCDYNILQEGGSAYGRGWQDEEGDAVAAVLDGSIPGYLWNKLVRRSLYERVEFPPQADIWEDKTLCVQLFYQSSKVAYVREPLYGYRIHPGGTCLSEDVRRKLAKQQANVSVILSFLERNRLSDKYGREISALKAEVQMNALPLPRKEYLAVYPENRWKQLWAGGIPLAWKLGHLTKMLGIHGISGVFRR
jgi:glycosyltransferase involved in cell wall biosynthesis